jgi:YbbR domain-containing protein
VRLLAFRPRPVPPPSEPPPPEEPRQPLVDWVRGQFRRPRPSDLRELVVRNGALKAVSLFLAFALWFSINVTEGGAERTFELEVKQPKVPEGLIITNVPAMPIAVRVRGPGTLLDNVDVRRRRIALDLSGFGPGRAMIDLGRDMIRDELPPRVKIVKFTPSKLELRLERKVKRSIPVRLDLAGTPALGYTVAETRVTPDAVDVSGPASRVDDLKEIVTEPLDLHGSTATVERALPLVSPGELVVPRPERVMAVVTLEELTMTREFERVEVKLVNAGGFEARIRPATIELVLRGPQRVLQHLKLDPGAVQVDVATLGVGRHEVVPRVQLPDDVEVARRRPEQVTVELVAPRAGR